MLWQFKYRHRSAVQTDVIETTTSHDEAMATKVARNHLDLHVSSDVAIIPGSLEPFAKHSERAMIKAAEAEAKAQRADKVPA